MKTGVFLCTCGRTIDIDFKKLRKSITADIIEIHDLLCHNEGLAKITDVFKRYELNQALIACTSRRQVFESLGLNLLFINLREHCGLVHERKEATEKAMLMVNAALHCPPSSQKTIIDVGRDVFIAGEPSVSMQIAQYLSRVGNVHVLSTHDTSPVRVLPEPSGEIKIYAGSVREIEGRIGEFCVNIIRNPIDTEKCISCGKCLDACPMHAIRHYPVFAIGKKCDSCGKCLDVCPAHAIDFKETLKTIKVGQILAIGDELRDIRQKKGIYVTGLGEKDEETFRLALPAVVEIMLNMGKIEQDKLLTLSLDECAGGKSGITGCMLCESICSHNAITRSGDRIMFDERSCRGCGACASVCPLSLPGIKDDVYSKMEYLLTGLLTPRILMIACVECMPLLDTAGRRRMKYPAVLPLFVPCIAGVSEAHILRAFDLGADGVILMGCRECQGLRSDEASKLAGLILAEFNLDARISLIMNNDDIEGFVKSVTIFSEHLTPSPLKKHEPVILKKASKRYIMLGLMAGFAAKTGIIPRIVIEDTVHPFADVSIDSKCTVCGACTAMCPTMALQRESGSIKFIYGYCIACGLCEKACPENALKIHRMLDLARLIDIRMSTLFESEMLVCASCKKQYMTAAAFDRIAGSLIANVRNDLTPQEQVELIKGQVELLKYCEECRPLIAVQKMGLFS